MRKKAMTEGEEIKLTKTHTLRDPSCFNYRAENVTMHEMCKAKTGQIKVVKQQNIMKNEI